VAARICDQHGARAQVARTFTGPQDDELAEHMAACNARGPLAAHIAKLIPKADCSGFDALARVFSGTVKPGDRVRVLGEVPRSPPWQCARGLLCTA